MFEFKRRQVKGAQIIYVERDQGDPEQGAFDPAGTVLFARFLPPSRRHPVEIYIKPPYRSPKLEYGYEDGEFLDFAQKTFASIPLEDYHLTVTVCVRDGEIVSLGTNAGYHLKHGCHRQNDHLTTGVGYDRCPGCLPRNHSEQQAIRQARQENGSGKLENATAYLYGHWWSCQSCTRAMEAAGIKKVIFSKTWTRDFLKIRLENPDPLTVTG